MARDLGRVHVFSRKQSPVYGSAEEWDECLLVSEFEKTRIAAGGMSLEVKPDATAPGNSSEPSPGVPS
jgi:hypothetical protein